jgi:hypothetical protein
MVPLQFFPSAGQLTVVPVHLLPSAAGMMSMAVLEAEKQQQQQQVAAHSPLEQKVVVSRGFAASGAQQQ